MKIIKKILTILSMAFFLLAIIIIINISVSVKRHLVPKIFGYSYMIVETGSMEPTLLVNDFIVVKEEEVYYPDDILSFYYDINGDDNKEVVTHRLKEIENDNYILKGDNDEGLQEIEEDDIIGKVVYHSTFLGSILSLRIFRNKNIVFAILVFSLLILIFSQIINIIKIMKVKKNS